MARCIMKTESIKKLNEIYVMSEDERVKRRVLEILRIEENRASGKFDYYKYVSKEESRPVMTGVYHDNGYKVATDAHILIAFKDEYDAELEGVVLKKDGTILKTDSVYTKYPNWRAVVPDLSCKRHPKRSETVQIDFDKWAELYKNYKADKKVDAEKRAVKVGGAYYNVELFHLLVLALKKMGTNEFTNTWSIRGVVARGFEIVEEYAPMAGFTQTGDGSLTLLIPMRVDAEEYYEL